MGKSSKTVPTGKQQQHKHLTREKLLVGFVLTLLSGVLVTVIVMLSIQEKSTQATINKRLYPESLAVETIYVSVDPKSAKISLNKYGRPQPILKGTNLKTYDDSFKTNTFDIRLEIGERLGYKTIMDSGEVLVYDWQSDGHVHFDFYANLIEDADFWTLYSEGNGRKEKGSIVAPYLGQHGWYWKNLEDRPVNVKLVVAGYYDDLIKNVLDAEEE